MQKPIIGFGYENIFTSFPWVVGVGGQGVYPAVWGYYGF